jgi:hypothetical protein
MIHLTAKPDAFDLTIFWAAISIFLVALVFFFTYPSVLPALLAAGATTLIGFRFRGVVTSTYDLWRSLTRFYVRLAKLWSIGVCFYVILGIAGSTKSELVLTRPQGKRSMWALWKTPEAALYSQPIQISKNSSQNRYWLASFINWANNPRHVWAFCLLPFVILLRMVEGEQAERFPTNIYTLY